MGGWLCGSRVLRPKRPGAVAPLYARRYEKSEYVISVGGGVCAVQVGARGCCRASGGCGCVWVLKGTVDCLCADFTLLLDNPHSQYRPPFLAGYLGGPAVFSLMLLSYLHSPMFSCRRTPPPFFCPKLFVCRVATCCACVITSSTAAVLMAGCLSALVCGPLLQ